MKIYTERYRRWLWLNHQVKYAEAAYNYPCVDIPSKKTCESCKRNGGKYPWSEQIYCEILGNK